MSSIFNDELAQARHKFLTNIGKITQLGVINNAASIAFNTHKGRKAYLEGYTTDEIKGYTLLFPELQAYIDKYRTREGFWRWSQSLPLKMKRLVHQYSVVFLVTIFEAFIGDVLLIVFKNRPECLSSEKIITWKNIIELGDYDSVINQLACQRASDVLSGDWKKIIDEFIKLFNIDLSDEIDTEMMTEVFAIRHAVVHNVGIVDERFMDKVKSSKWRIRYRINGEIRLNQQVMDNIQSYFDGAMEYIYDRIIDKFGLVGSD